MRSETVNYAAYGDSLPWIKIIAASSAALMGIVPQSARCPHRRRAIQSLCPDNHCRRGTFHTSSLATSRRLSERWGQGVLSRISRRRM